MSQANFSRPVVFRSEMMIKKGSNQIMSTQNSPPIPKTSIINTFTALTYLKFQLPLLEKKH